MAEFAIQRSVFLTGASGCLGTELARRLSRGGFHVRALVRDLRRAERLAALEGLELIEGDLHSPGALRAAARGCDIVYHLAALVHAPPGTSEAEFRRVNVEGTRNVLEAAIAGGASRVVFSSTVAVYPEREAIQNEMSPPEPATGYGASKLEAERLVLDSGIGATVLRFPVVYGARDRGNVARLIEAIRRGRYFIVGDGLNLKSMVAAGNAAEAAMLAADARAADGATYNVCDARPYSQLEIAETIAEILGRPKNFLHLPAALAHNAALLADAFSGVTGIELPLTSDRVRKLAANTVFSSARIEKELGFNPRISLREGLAEEIGETNQAE